MRSNLYLWDGRELCMEREIWAKKDCREELEAE